MDVYLDRSDFQYLQMDIDSIYLTIFGSSIDGIIRPEMRKQYEKGLKGFCNNDTADAKYHWFPGTCCPKHMKHDKRTPGLFKLNFEWEEMLGHYRKHISSKNLKSWKSLAIASWPFIYWEKPKE